MKTDPDRDLADCSSGEGACAPAGDCSESSCAPRPAQCTEPDCGDDPPAGCCAIEAQGVEVYYGKKKVLTDVSFGMAPGRITAIIGPSGCGKSTLLRSFNRMNDFVEGVGIDGQLLYRGIDIHDPRVDPMELRLKIGMVFQKPNPFPKSIYRNVAWGPKINRYDGNIKQLVEESLRKAALWDEVKDRLDDSALGLSGGQQQRLCIARALAMSPEVILMDEPCSALDPVSTSRIEDLIFELKKTFTIVIVTHNMQQAARVSDTTAFLELGKLIEVGETDQMFTKPREKRTEDYVSGRFG